MIAGHRLFWQIEGPPDGKPVLLLHHGLGSLRTWKKQIPALTAAGWRTLAYDRWGYGRSDARPAFSPDFLRDDAGEAVRLLDQLGLERVRVVGHSDGGSLALLLASGHPERVERMVVVAAHIDREAATLDGLRALAQAVESQPLKGGLRREHGAKADDLARAWLARWLDPAMAGLTLQPALASIHCPTLVIQGELDEHATPDHARRIAAGIAGSELWLIPGVGHMPLHEVPGAFNARLLEFLGRSDASDSLALVESSPGSARQR
jgi:pimeloyl-ACP methyl ester carboxylesterase